MVCVPGRHLYYAPLSPLKVARFRPAPPIRLKRRFLTRPLEGSALKGADGILGRLAHQTHRPVHHKMHLYDCKRKKFAEQVEGSTMPFFGTQVSAFQTHRSRQAEYAAAYSRDG